MNLVFAHELRVATLKFIEKLTINNGPDSATKRILVSFVREEIISREDLEEAAHKALVAAGRRSLVECTKGDTWADHTTSPEALGYLIGLGVLTSEEIASIRFDHNQTVESFPTLYNPRGTGLCAHMVEQLLSPKGIPFSESTLG